MIDFTKISWGGEECILVTSSYLRNPRMPLLILTKQDIELINIRMALREKDVSSGNNEKVRRNGAEPQGHPSAKSQENKNISRVK